MDQSMTRLGGSLQVPSVQEQVAKEPLTTLPPRYIRLDQHPSLAIGTDSLPQVPVINLHSLFCGDETKLELEKLHHACKHWGFFQVPIYYIGVRPERF
ncbi:hypothetical protein Vadar_001662 [Vaccinium darrowii]|uniref:Uncharacterized protein n=1 Tax=Vaccinium darrowii TaxID=229202 RepID=A0ACB7X7C3_9ERIC|nr:hypothetical protein Vadar_001662 [Vaccinium darrowii]